MDKPMPSLPAATAVAAKLTELFGFHIPARWSVAQLRQALLGHESHTRGAPLGARGTPSPMG